MRYNDDLQKFFPAFHELKPIQETAISNIVERSNTLCILPTGEGKSLIYWMSAVELGGICIVISPLTALISEQAEKLRSYGYDAIEFTATNSPKKQMETLLQIGRGERTPNFIFSSPEKLDSDGFLEYCIKLRHNDIKLIVLDEVHCVSQWGISFRPAYKRIPMFLNNVFGANSWCRILALTATLNPLELQDICTEFHIAKEDIVKKELLMRSNIQLHVKKYLNENEKEEQFWELLKRHDDEKILVYVYRKESERGVEKLCQKAVEDGYHANFFHGDMSSSERLSVISEFRNGDINLIFATNAFGMGIDIPDIRVIIHYMIPESIEQYYQEVGRAARDGKSANAYLLYTDKNVDVKRNWFIDKSFPSDDELKQTYHRLFKKEGIVPFTLFDNDDDKTQCFPYYLVCGAIDILGKGFSDMKFLKSIHDSKIQTYYDSTKTKAFNRTLKNNNITAEELTKAIYQAIVDGTVTVTQPPSRWLVLDVHTTELSEPSLSAIREDIEKKKAYKHDLLTYFVQLLESHLNSKELHQEIARYLGTDKHKLNCIYETFDHNHVRSKSEVIICNLLSNAGITYTYEKKLFYDSNSYMEPDFTIEYGGKTYYWEHLGMLGNDEYDKRWSQKLGIYNQFFPGQLIKTYESGALSVDAQSIIDKIKSGTA